MDRVYVELEAAPWVWRVGDDATVASHTGMPAAPRQALVDDRGRLFLDCDAGYGIVHTLDMNAAADAVEELEETARLHLLLQGHRTRPLTPEQAADLRTRQGVAR